MAHNDRGGFAPKIRVLSQNETQASFETWKETLLFNLDLDGTFEIFLGDDVTWEDESSAHRGLRADPAGQEGAKTARQKAAILHRLLGTIASYAPVISRQFITKEALSLDAIWHRLRIFYGFRKSGSLILDLTSLSLEEGESYESLWERIYAFFMDNLLSPSDHLQHLQNENPPKELMSPTLLNTAVVIWLKCIHEQLPSIVKQKYATELRNKTLVTIREEISESLESMLNELKGENVNISRTTHRNNPRRRPPIGPNPKPNQEYSRKPSYSPRKFCCLCEANHRPTNHFLSECPYLPQSDRRYMSRSQFRVVEATDDDDYEQYYDDEEYVEYEEKSARAVNLRKVDVASSPYLSVNFGPHPVNILLDSGAETNLIELEFVKSLKIPIKKTTTSASLADGTSSLDIVGEVHIVFTKEDLSFKFDALVSRNLTDKVIAGIPFLSSHDIYSRPSRKTIYVGKREFQYGSRNPSSKASILRVSRQTTLLPGENLMMKVPDDLIEEENVAVEPKIDAPSLKGKFGNLWIQPQIVPTCDGNIKLTNNSQDPVLISRHEQLALIRPTCALYPTNSPTVQEEPVQSSTPSYTTDFLDVSVDPNNLFTPQMKQSFISLHKEKKKVFDSRELGCYNGKSGPLQIVINMGPTQPPQRKGRLPLYNDAFKQEMQQICDSLEGTVLLKPEEVGVTAEYINPSFLVKKTSGKKRLVTAFAEVGSYSKPQPALMTDTNSVIRKIGNWSYLIKTDLTSAYWQIPLQKNSMKYCGIVTPYKGVRVYGRGAMGMPGTETALEELLSRILGDQIAKGGVAKIADDLYIGGSTPQEAYNEWEKVLNALQDNGLRLSAAKTVVCPKSVTILGWIWQQGTLRASPHKISTLAAVEPPTTVRKLRSYIGGVKFLSRVMKNYSDVLHPLEEIVAGREPSDKIIWNDHLLSVFKRSQSELQNSKTLTIPRSNDQLNIVTDASEVGVAAALYVVRNNKPLIAGYYNSKLKKHQERWLPCELEALSINAAVTHFSTDIVNSQHQTIVLTDSLPCVQAYNKLRKGQFSSSSRVSTFLSVLSRFNVHILHIKGSSNIYSDYASRNPLPCTTKECQICSYIKETSDSVVRSCSVQEVLDSSVPVPFSSRNGWLELQLSDDVLRRTSANLKQGTKPGRKETNIRDVKRYLQIAKKSKDGLLVVEHYSPSRGKTERIIVPRKYLHGLLECLHLKLAHPSKSQLRQVFGRAYYALDLEEALDAATKRCHTCTALSDMPNRFLHQSSITNPTSIGSNFSADIVKRNNQQILILREYVSSFTTAKLVLNEKASTLRTALIVLGSDVIPPSGPLTIIKVDPASSFRSLVDCPSLKKSGMILQLGEPKYVNKNPVAEKSVREFHSEVNRLLMDSSLITEQLLANAISNMNSRIRREGLSSREIWLQRDQYTNEQLPINDMLIIKSQQKQKNKNQIASSSFKARGKTTQNRTPIEEGSIIYINSDRSKTHPRERYIVTAIYKNTCKVQKFTGRQLRARPYIVNQDDVITIPVWKFEHDDSPNSDEETNNEKRSQPIRDNEEQVELIEENEINQDIEQDNHEHPQNPEGALPNQNAYPGERNRQRPERWRQLTGDEDELDEKGSDEETIDKQERKTRSGRNVKPPDRWQSGSSRRVYYY